jgi:hypothetical protein
MTQPAPITEDEVRDLVEGFFRSMHAGGPVEVQRPMFAPGVGIEAWTGRTFALDEHLALHEAFANEQHKILSLTIEPMAGDRVRAIGEVEWQAEIRGTGAVIRSIVGEDWTIERNESGRARFARYFSTGIRYLPGSAKLEI